MINSSGKRGFTLIELLVVIAIIAILAAILFPVFTRAREKANQTTCSSNQRQIAATIQMYAQDHEETFFSDPVDKPWNAPFKSNEGNDIYDCPSKDGSGSTEYCFNMFLFGKSLGDIDNPSVALLTADANTSNPAKNYSMRGSGDIDGRHSNGCIVSCVDGHVAYDTLTGANTKMASLMIRGYQFMVGPGTLLQTNTGPYDTGYLYADNRNPQPFPSHGVIVDGQAIGADTTYKCVRNANFIQMPVGSYQDSTNAFPNGVQISVELSSQQTDAAVNGYFTVYDPGTSSCHSTSSWNTLIPFTSAVTVYMGNGLCVNSSSPLVSKSSTLTNSTYYKYVLTIINKKEFSLDVYNGATKISSMVGTQVISDTTLLNSKMALYCGSSAGYNIHSLARNISVRIW